MQHRDNPNEEMKKERILAEQIDKQKIGKMKWRVKGFTILVFTNFRIGSGVRKETIIENNSDGSLELYVVIRGRKKNMKGEKKGQIKGHTGLEIPEMEVDLSSNVALTNSAPGCC